jgi:hypothetical protein
MNFKNRLSLIMEDVLCEVRYMHLIYGPTDDPGTRKWQDNQNEKFQRGQATVYLNTIDELLKKYSTQPSVEQIKTIIDKNFESLLTRLNLQNLYNTASYRKYMNYISNFLHEKWDMLEIFADVDGDESIDQELIDRLAGGQDRE